LTQKIILGLRRLLRNRVYTVRNGLAKGLWRKGGLGFLPKRMTAEQKLLLKQDFKGRVVYDIGGWEGIFTLFFARAAAPDGQVVTFEPNPDNRRIIQGNLELNGFQNVTLRPVALGQLARKAELVVSRNNTGTGAIHNQRKGRNLAQAGARTHEVEVDTLDHQIEAYHLPSPDFIKIDVEGMELEVLRGMEGTIRRIKPHILVEVHECGPAGDSENAKKVVEWLESRNYMLMHVESEQPVSSANATHVSKQHLYCT